MTTVVVGLEFNDYYYNHYIDSIIVHNCFNFMIIHPIIPIIIIPIIPIIIIIILLLLVQ